MSKNSPHAIKFIPLRCKPKRTRFDLMNEIAATLRKNGHTFHEGDVLVVSSKYVAMSQGQVVKLSRVKPTAEAIRLAARMKMSHELAHLVIQEAESIYGGVPGFLLASKNGVLSPNAGIDRSNVPLGYVILHPNDPQAVAHDLRRKIRKIYGRSVGIILTDSRLMPTRIGTTGVAIGVAGLEPVRDERGRTDLFGKRLRVTQRAIADDLCSGAQLLMGEADEAIAMVLVRCERRVQHLPWRMVDRRVKVQELSVRPEECIYVRGLKANLSR